MVYSEEKRRFFTGIYLALIVVAIMWLVKAVELIGGISFVSFGVLPLQIKGLWGIIFSPLIHADMAHLTANSAPMFLLTAALVYYYRKEAFRLFSILWILTGLWVWLFARGESYHIGASGVVYGLAAFHFTGGFIRREPGLMAFSMLIIFLYGSMIWGFFPEFFPKKNISWESHLMGAVAGVLLAVYYRKTGPQAKVYHWDEEEEEEDDFSDTGTPGGETKPEPESSKSKENSIIYHYKNEDK
ncbi:MAG: rhomboid family intramembrane serine protease [Lentimicrobium sp.]|nr:rhomboid family intramembrane serine protease [Lentimicrobium sp.]